MAKLLLAVKMMAVGAAVGAALAGMPIAAADDDTDGNPPAEAGAAADNGGTPDEQGQGNPVPKVSIPDYSKYGDFYQKPGQQPGQYKLVNPSQGAFWACYNGVLSYLYAGNPMLPGAVMSDPSTCV
ncbi:MAG: hypothetical protein H6523_10685 [Mycolicibacterium sp.]|nr:hypothetical protein [Mycolicibacterium sp.]